LSDNKISALGKSKRLPQIALRLAPDDERRLEAAMAKSGATLSDEVRERLRRTFDQDERDPKARQLTEAIDLLITAAKPYGGWHTDPYAFRVFRDALTRVLNLFMPAGELKPSLTLQSSAADLGISDVPSPESAGHTIAVAVIQELTMREIKLSLAEQAKPEESK
jgi:aminopeptidase N